MDSAKAIIAIILLTAPLRIWGGDEFADLNNQRYFSLPGVYKNLGRHELQTPREFIPHVDYGYLTRPSSQIRSTARTNKEIIFDVLYSTDEFSRRKNLIKPVNNQEKFLLIAGCSFIFGYGLNDHETLNHAINQSSSPYYAYNYAMSSSSLNHLLARIKLENSFSNQVEFSSGELMYFFISDHVARTVGAWPNLWMKDTPYFSPTEKSGLKINGTVQQGQSLFTRFIISLTQFMPSSFFSGKIIPKLNDGHYAYFCSLIREVDREWKSSHPSGRFIFALHPFDQTDSRITNCLKQNNIEFISFELEKAIEYYKIPQDNHPNAQLNKLLAGQLLDYLANLKD
jgi:hypothetical protein